MKIGFIKTDQRHQQLHSVRKRDLIELDWYVTEQPNKYQQQQQPPWKKKIRSQNYYNTLYKMSAFKKKNKT